MRLLTKEQDNELMLKHYEQQKKFYPNPVDQKFCDIMIRILDRNSVEAQKSSLSADDIRKIDQKKLPYLVSFLAAHHQSLSKSHRYDAMTYLFVYLVMLKKFGKNKGAQYDLESCNNDDLFNVVHLYGINWAFKACVNAGVLDKSQVVAYIRWERKHREIVLQGKGQDWGTPSGIDLLKSYKDTDGCTLEGLFKDFYASVLFSARDSLIPDDLYVEHVDFIDMFSAYEIFIQKSLNQDSLGGKEQRYVPQVLKYILDRSRLYAEKAGQNEGLFKSVFSKVIAAASGGENKVFKSYFKAMYLYGLGQDLAQAVETKSLHPNMLKAYTDFQTTEADFIARHTTILDAGTDITVTEDLPVLPAAAAEPEAESLVPAVANSTVLDILNQSYGLNLEFYQQKLETANSKASQDLYRHIVDWERESAGILESSKENQDRYLKRIMTFRKKLFDLAVEGYDSFTEDDKRIIVWRLQTTLLPTDLLVDYWGAAEKGDSKSIEHIKHEFDLEQNLFNAYYKKNPFISIFQMVHLYGLAEKFEQKCDLKEFSSQFRTAYKNWKKRNAEFIAECAARNAVTHPPQEIDSMPAIEDAAVEPPSGETPAVVGANDNPAPEEPSPEEPSPEEPSPEEPSPEEQDPEIASSSSCAQDPRITEIFVRRPLVTSGNNTEGMGYAPDGEENDEAPSSPVGDTFENRTQALINHILADDTSFPFAYMTVVWDKRPVKTKGTAEKPYNLIYLEMEDGSRTCLAVCGYWGHTTYVERDAPPYKDTDVLQISSLKKNPKVWTIPHVTHEQWTSGLHTLVYTPLEQLTVDPKTRNYWYSLKDALVQSFAATIMASGKIPATNDNAAIAFGPLRDRSKWCNVYSALKREAVSGLPEGAKTFKKLFNALANGCEGAEAPLPELKKFLNKAPVTEAMIEVACKRFKEEYDVSVDPDFFDALMIDPVDTRFNDKTEPDLRRTGKDIDLAFKFGAVVLSPERVAKLGRYPSGLQEYLELCLCA